MRVAARVRSPLEGSLKPGYEITHVCCLPLFTPSPTHITARFIWLWNTPQLSIPRIKLEPRSLAQPCPSSYPLPHLPSAPFPEPSPSPRPADCSLTHPYVLNLIISSNSSKVKVPILGNSQAASRRGASAEPRPHPTYLLTRPVPQHDRNGNSRGLLCPHVQQACTNTCCFTQPARRRSLKYVSKTYNV